MTVVSLRLGWIHTPETFKQQLMPMWMILRRARRTCGVILIHGMPVQACRLALAGSPGTPTVLYCRARYIHEDSDGGTVVPLLSRDQNPGRVGGDAFALYDGVALSVAWVSISTWDTWESVLLRRRRDPLWIFVVLSLWLKKRT